MAAWANAVGTGIPASARIVETEIDRAIAQTPLPQYLLGLAAEILLIAGRAADGIKLLDRALAGIDEPGVGLFLPEIYRLRGRCLLALNRNNKTEARTEFEQAIAIAATQGATRFLNSARDDLAAL